MPAGAHPTATVLLIGAELLSGKIRDENGWYLAGVLRRRGIKLLEIAIVEDDIDAISNSVQRLLRLAPLLFTAGGVGPTHDDLTLDGVAAALGRERVRHPQMAEILLQSYGERANESVMRMADLPTGTVLCAARGWPVMRLDLTGPTRQRMYLLPGIPSLLQAKIEALDLLPNELPRGPAWSLHTIRTELDESELAAPLEIVVHAHPGVAIGSYPKTRIGTDGQSRREVELTFEADDAATAIAALEAFRSAIQDR